jgi:hypothetical protein
MRLVWRTTWLTLLALIAGAPGLFPSLQAREQRRKRLDWHPKTRDDDGSNSQLKLITHNYRDL